MPHLYITLVHGTWGRGMFPNLPQLIRRKKSFWFEEKSLFRQHLQEELSRIEVDYSIRSFEWSGANSIAERARAANRLAEYLVSNTESKEIRHLVIAHSHGGNVIKLALSQIKDNSQISIVTLATPFVEIHPLSEAISHVTSFMFISSGLMLFLCYASLRLNFVQNILELSVFIPMIFGFLLAAIFSVIMGVTLKYSLRKTVSLSSLTHGGLDWSDVSRALIIRAVDDEAALVLAAGSIGNRISMMIVSTTARVFSFFVTRTYSAIFIVATGLIVYIWLDNGYLNMRALDLILGDDKLVLYASFPSIFGSIAFAVSGCFKTVYGRELFWGTLDCEISSHSAPDIGSTVQVVTLRPQEVGESRLRHCIYDHKDCVSTIVEWLKKSGSNK